jgi:predicted metal-dependent hydrolase
MIPGEHAGITMENRKGRWGSCSSTRELTFNWRLMLAPKEIIDYVVVHELCHLTHMDHSPAYWKAVGKVLSDYKERREWLKENGIGLNL